MSNALQNGPVYGTMKPWAGDQTAEIAYRQRICNLKGFAIASSFFLLIPITMMVTVNINLTLMLTLAYLWLPLTWVAWKYRADYRQAPLGLMKAIGRLFLITTGLALILLCMGGRR